MGGRNAFFTEAAEEVQISSTTCVRCSYWSRTSRGSAVTQGPWTWFICHWEVTTVPRRSSREKILLSPGHSRGHPPVKHVLLSSGGLEPPKPDVSSNLVSVPLAHWGLPAASKAAGAAARRCAWAALPAFTDEQDSAVLHIACCSWLGVVRSHFHVWVLRYSCTPLRFLHSCGGCN